VACARFATGHGTAAFRVFYVVENATDVYVLHAFQKKTQRTSALDLEKGRARYKLIP
jgi:phage-related protein